MSLLKKAASGALSAVLVASLFATIVAPTALASTAVTSAGTVPAGGVSAGSATFTLTENSAAAFPPSGGTLTIALRDSASAATIHFSGTPSMTTPDSLGAKLTVAGDGTSLTITMASSSSSFIEQVIISSRLAADSGAAAGAIQATVGGTLVGSVTGATETATGTLLSAITDQPASVAVAVSSPCGFGVTGGSNTSANFSDTSDARLVLSATALSGGQQTLSLSVGFFSHPAGTTISQTVADCHGVNLTSPGTVGGSVVNHLAFTVQPGGGAPNVPWASQPVVAVQNSLNQVVTTDNTTFVTLSIGTNPAAGTLTCTSGLIRQVVNGQAVFSGCSINNPSASAYTLFATSSPAFTPTTSAGFLIGTTTNNLAFTTQPGGGAAGAVWASQPVVSIRNSLGQVVTTDNTTIVTLGIGTNPTGGNLACTSGLSRPAIAGVATFFGCSINLASASPYTLVATSSPGATPATSAAFLIGGTGNHLTFTTQPSGGAPNGAWAGQPVVAVQNSLNQTVTTDNSTLVTLSIGTNPAGGTVNCQSGLTRPAINGVATFFGCSINVGSVNPYTLVASGTPVLTQGVSNPFLISGAVTAVALTDLIAPGVNKGLTGFGTASLVVPANSYITLLLVSNPNLAGASMQIWSRTKTGTWHLVTSRTVASDATVHYYARVNGWTAYQGRFAGDATHSPASSHGRIATNP